jgi:uncharacterized protein
VVVAAVAVAAAVGVEAAAVEAEIRDRVGLGWRGELAAGIFANLGEFDILEVIADDYFHASRSRLRALRTLAAQVPLTLHGVAMGLASSMPVQTARLESMAHLVNAIQPESWSEHLAFVRAGGMEIGHLAAPPRTTQTVAATIANIDSARRIVGTAPLLENIATLIDPPASTMDETQWITAIANGADIGLLLDLHNLYANAVNFGADPHAMLLRLPLHKVRSVHLSGGKWIVEPGSVDPPRMRLLDDHVHDVPAEVFSLLTVLAQHASQPLTVILERDGCFPAFDRLLEQLSAARAALQLGRSCAAPATCCAPSNPASDISYEVSPALETFLARLYVDTDFREYFMGNAEHVTNTAGLNEEEARALCKIDRVGLQMAAASYAAKRAGHHRKHRSLWQSVRHSLDQLIA